MNYIMLFRSNNGLIKININDFINDKEYYKCLQYNIINKYNVSIKPNNKLIYSQQIINKLLSS